MQRFLLGLVILFGFYNCEESDLVNTDGTLTLTVENLPQLNNENISTTYNYEAWLLLNGTFVNVGTFNDTELNENSNLNKTFNGIDTSDLADADGFAITVENSSSSAAPSNYVLMVGDFEGNTANLSVNKTTNAGVSTIAVDAMASFTIQTPTTTDATDDANGIWFFTNDGMNDVTTLNLDFNRSDVLYQAWLTKELSDNAIHNFNIGVISANDGTDDSSLFITSTENIPEFVGEDFIGDPTSITFPDNTFPLNVIDGTVSLRAIPTGYSSDTIPFPIILFEFEISSGTVIGTTNSIEMNLNETYSAVATRQ